MENLNLSLWVKQRWSENLGCEMLNSYLIEILNGYPAELYILDDNLNNFSYILRNDLQVFLKDVDLNTRWRINEIW